MTHDARWPRGRTEPTPGAGELLAENLAADELARRTIAALEGERSVEVPGGVNQAIATLARLLPEGAATALSTGFSRRYRGR